MIGQNLPKVDLKKFQQQPQPEITTEQPQVPEPVKETPEFDYSEAKKVIDDLQPVELLDGSYAKPAEAEVSKEERLKLILKGRSDYEIIQDFNRKWGSGPNVTPARTLRLLAPDLISALRMEEINEAAAWDAKFFNETGLPPTLSTENKDPNPNDTGLLYRDAAGKPVPNRPAYVDKLIEDFMVMHDLSDPKEDSGSALFINYIKRIQQESSWLIDPNKLRNRILREKLIDQEAYNHVHEDSIALFTMIRQGVYDFYGTAYDALTMPEFETTRTSSIATALAYSAAQYAAPILSFSIGAKFVAAPALNFASAAGLKLIRPLVSRNIAPAITGFMTNLLLKRQSYLLMPAFAKFIGTAGASIYAGGVMNRLLNPIIDKSFTPLKEEPLLNSLRVESEESLVSRILNTDFSFSTVIKEDFPVFIESLGLLLAIKGGISVIKDGAKLKVKFKNDQEKVKFMDQELPEGVQAANDIAYEANRAAAQIREDGLNALTTDDIVKIAEQGEQKENSVVDDDPNSTVPDIKKMNNFIIETSSDDAFNKGIKLYDFRKNDIKDTTPTRSKQMLILLSRVVASVEEASNQKKIFKELRDIVSDPEFFEKKESVDKIFDYLHNRIEFKHDNSTIISTKMKLHAIAESFVESVLKQSSDFDSLETGRFSNKYERQAYNNVFKRKLNVRMNKILKDNFPNYKTLDKFLENIRKNAEFEEFKSDKFSTEDIVQVVKDAMTELAKSGIDIDSKQFKTLVNIEKLKEIVKNKAKSAYIDTQLKAQFTNFIKTHSTIKDKPITNGSFSSAMRSAYNKMNLQTEQAQTVMVNEYTKVKQKLIGIAMRPELNLDLESLTAHLMQITIYPETKGIEYEGRPRKIPVELDQELSSLGFDKIFDIQKKNYFKLLELTDPTTSLEKRHLADWFPQQLDYNMIQSLRAMDPGAFKNFLKEHYESLDKGRMRDVRDDITQKFFERDMLPKLLDNAAGADVLPLTTAVIESFIAKVLKKEQLNKKKELPPAFSQKAADFMRTLVDKKISKNGLNEIKSYLIRRRYGLVITEDIHKSILDEVLDSDKSYDPVTGGFKLNSKIGPIGSIDRLMANPDARVFFYKNFMAWHEISNNYGKFLSTADSFLDMNRSNLRKQAIFENFGHFREIEGGEDVTAGLNIKANLPEKFMNLFGTRYLIPDESRSSRFGFKKLTKDSLDVINQKIILPIIEDINGYDQGNSTLRKSALGSGLTWLGAISNGSNLGSMGLTSLVTDGINSIVQQSKLGISFPVVLGDMVSTFLKGVDENVARQARLVLDESARYESIETASMTPYEKKLYPNIYKSNKFASKFSNFTTMASGARYFTNRFLVAAKLSSKVMLFDEMKRGEYGNAWKKLEPYGMSRQVFDALEQFHRGIEDGFMIDSIDDLKVGRQFNAALDYYARSIVTHASPTTKKVLASMGVGGLAVMTLFYLASSTTQETINKTIYPLFFEKNYKSFGMNLMGDLIAAIMLKSARAITSGKKPDWSDPKFYKDLGNEMPTISPIYSKLIYPRIESGGNFFTDYSGIFAPINPVNLADPVKFVRHISPFSTTPILRILQERLIIDNMYKWLHPETYRKHIAAVNRQAAEKGTPYFVKRGK